MNYRRLGQTGLRVSVIGIGTYQYGGEWGKEFTQHEVNAILGRGGDLGINIIDTAECYGDHLSEALIGRALQGRRSEWTIATKFGHRFRRHQTRDQIWTPAGVREQLEASLAALQTDYIDLYQFHSGNNEVFANDALLSMLHEQVQAGKVRHLGVSLSKRPQIDIVRQAEAAASMGLEVVQINYNRLDRGAEEEIFPICLRQGLGVLARVPLASGFLSGKYQPGVTFPANDVRSGLDPSAIAERLQRVEEIRAGEVPAGADMAQWAIAWCLRHEAVSCCIPGCKDPGQLETGAGAADLEADPALHPLAWR